MRYVIIGNSAAGVAAAESIRSLDARGEITIIGHEPYHAYSRPLAAHLVAGELDEGAIRLRPADFYDRLGVQARLGVRAIGLDLEARQVVLANGENIAYDRLLLATGSVTRFPSVEGRDLPGVFDFWTLNDAKAVAGWARRCHTAVVVGAGLVGVQAAYGLHQAGLKVTLVDVLPQVLGRILDAGGAAVVQQVLEDRGVGVELGHALARIEGTADSGVTGVVLDDGWRIECGLVIRATGVAPNVVLAEGTPIAVNRGILVNQFLETSVPGVYAAGDVAETHDAALGETVVNANWPNAVEQGRIAGLNMAGQPTPLAGSLAMTSIPVWGLPVFSIGVIEPRGLPGYEVRVRAHPEHQIYQKLVIRDGRLKGAIFIGDTRNVGLTMDLIRRQTPVGLVKDALLGEKAQYYHFRRALVSEEMEGVGLPWAASLSSTEVYRKRFDDEQWAERERDEREW